MNPIIKYLTLSFFLIAICPTKASDSDYINNNNIDPASSQQSLLPENDDEHINESANALAAHLGTDLAYLANMAAIKFTNIPDLEGFLPCIQLTRASSLGYLNYCAWSDMKTSPQAKTKLFFGLVLFHTLGDIAYEFPQVVQSGLMLFVTMVQSIQEYVPLSVFLAAATATLMINKFKKSGDLKKILSFWFAVLTQQDEFDKKRV